MEPLAEEKPRLMVELPVRDKTNMDPLMELPTSREKYILEALVEETPRMASQQEDLELVRRSSEESFGEEVERVMMIGEEEHSPSPFLPKR